MFIGIDARLYGPRHAGIGRYTMELVKNLERIDSVNQYVIFLQRDNFDAYQPSGSNFRKVLADYRAYGWQEQLLFPFLLRQYKFDFVHFTHFNVPLFYRRKFIATIHDLIISHYPSSRSTTLNPLIYNIKLFFYRLIVKSTARRAVRIIAVTDYTKNDIVKFLDVPDKKITTVYEGVDLPPTSSGGWEILDRLGISGDFLLYVGSAYPHKNLEKLIDAYYLVGKKYPFLQLVLVGKNNFFYERLKEFVAKESVAVKNGLKDYPVGFKANNKILDVEGTKETQPAGSVIKRIIFSGYLNDQDLVAVYQAAKLYVFPSLIEGFGLPPLEAQSYGIPVVSSNATCLPEVLGDSVVYFNPHSAEDMAEKILSVLDSDDLRRQLIAKGTENVKRYSWEKMGREILENYKKI